MNWKYFRRGSLVAIALTWLLFSLIVSVVHSNGGRYLISGIVICVGATIVGIYHFPHAFRLLSLIYDKDSWSVFPPSAAAAGGGALLLDVEGDSAKRKQAIEEKRRRRREQLTTGNAIEVLGGFLLMGGMLMHAILAIDAQQMVDNSPYRDPIAARTLLSRLLVAVYSNSILTVGGSVAAYVAVKFFAELEMLLGLLYFWFLVAAGGAGIVGIIIEQHQQRAAGQQ